MHNSSRLVFYALFLLLAAASLAYASPTATFSTVFGSCSKHDGDHSFWAKLFEVATGNKIPEASEQKTSAATRLLDGMLWLGDIVYQDEIVSVPLWPTFLPVHNGDLSKFWKLFRNLHNYSEFVASTRHVMGIFDDHDLGANDEGKDYPHKAESQQLLLDFLGVPVAEDSNEATPQHREAKVRRTRDGVYALHRLPFHHEGNDSNHPKPVCFVLLDGRTHRDYDRADGEGDVLGERQWTWLKDVLRTGSDPDLTPLHSDQPEAASSIDDVCTVTFIASGVQVLEDALSQENWGQFPRARDRLIATIRDSGARRLVLLSGDVHFAEINMISPVPIFSVQDTKQPTVRACAESPFPDQELFEVTSSGFTHTDPGWSYDPRLFEFVYPSHRRQGPPILKKNAAILNVSCPLEKQADLSCNVTVTIVSLPDVAIERQIHLNFQENREKVKKDHLALAQLETTNPILFQTMRRRCSGDGYSDATSSYQLPLDYAPWTKAIVWCKWVMEDVLHGPHLTRLEWVFIHIWSLLCVTVGVLIFVFLKLLRLCCGRSTNNGKHLRAKQE